MSELQIDWRAVARQAQESRDAAFDMACDYRQALEAICSKHGFPFDRFHHEALALARQVMDHYDGPVDKGNVRPEETNRITEGEQEWHETHFRSGGGTTATICRCTDDHHSAGDWVASIASPHLPHPISSIIADHNEVKVLRLRQLASGGQA